jgi:hypothetical protein
MRRVTGILTAPSVPHHIMNAEVRTPRASFTTPPSPPGVSDAADGILRATGRLPAGAMVKEAGSPVKERELSAITPAR